MLSMDETYRAHARTVYRYLLSQCRDTSLAEELTQETFYQAVRCANRFDGSCKVTTWLCAIAKNVLLAERRKHPPVDSLSEDTPSPDSIEDTVQNSAVRLDLVRQMHALDGDMREVVYLRLLGELSFREIGDILSHTENWARVTYYRGKELLKKELTPHEE